MVIRIKLHNFQWSASAVARLWNSLPPDIVACDTLFTALSRTQNILFRQSYPFILF